MISASVSDMLARTIGDDITVGRLAPGTRLPSTVALARAHGVTVHAIQSALTQLHHRGLLTRSRRRGTFVALNAGSSLLGVVMGRNLLTDPSLRVYGFILDHLTRATATRNFQIRLYLPGPQQDQRRDLDNDLATGLLRAVVVLARQPGTAAILPDMGSIPLLDLPLPDYAMLAQIGMRHLLADGPRRIGVIPCDPDIGTDAFHRGIDRALAEVGMSFTCIDWYPGGNSQEVGHNSVKASLANPPDAWLIGDDNTAHGVVTALLLAGTRFPGAVRLVTHANRGIPPFPPLELTRLEVDPRAAANALVANLSARLSGTTPPVTTLTPTLVVGET